MYFVYLLLCLIILLYNLSYLDFIKPLIFSVNSNVVKKYETYNECITNCYNLDNSICITTCIPISYFTYEIIDTYNVSSKYIEFCELSRGTYYNYDDAKKLSKIEPNVSICINKYLNDCFDCNNTIINIIIIVILIFLILLILHNYVLKYKFLNNILISQNFKKSEPETIYIFSNNFKNYEAV